MTYDIGFRGLPYFNRSFRRYGVMPTDVRQSAILG
jgi:AraC-like DNA-binding protein